MKQQQNMIVVSLALWAGLGSGVLAAQTSDLTARARTHANPVPYTERAVKSGQTIFAKYCAFCHGTDARGNGLLAPAGTHPPDLTDGQWIKGSADGEIFAVIQRGAGESSPMRPFAGKLSDRDIWHVVHYLRSLGPKKRS